MEKPTKSSNFFKNFGMGLVYTIVFPLIVVASFVYGFIGFCTWLASGVGGIIRFFKGEEFYPTLREDKEVALVMKTQHDAMLNGVPPAPDPIQPGPSSNSVYVQNNYYSQPQKNAEPVSQTTPPEAKPYIEGNASFTAPTLSQDNPVNPTPITQNRPQIQINQSSQEPPTLAAIPPYSPQDSAPEVHVDPLGDDSHDIVR